MEHELNLDIEKLLSEDDEPIVVAPSACKTKTMKDAVKANSENVACSSSDEISMDLMAKASELSKKTMGNNYSLNRRLQIFEEITIDEGQNK